MKVLTREEILGASDLKTERIHIPAWGGDVIIRTITAKERDQFEDHCAQIKGKTCEGIMALLVALTTVNEAGEKIFLPEDIEALGQKSCAVVSMLFTAAQKLNATTDKDIEDLAKN